MASKYAVEDDDDEVRIIFTLLTSLNSRLSLCY